MKFLAIHLAYFSKSLVNVQELSLRNQAIFLDTYITNGLYSNMVIKLLRQVSAYIDTLPKEQRAIIYAVLEDIKQYGLQAPLVSMRQIKGKLWEVKISQIRIFYVVIEKNTMVLLHVYKKQSQRAPQHEIETALRRMKDVLEN
ncbi:MAG: putative Toxin-antitoxin system, toxin component, RelE family [Candidatus Brocadiaceae bacterium]|nr:putative Toxin-antitoxin system, toxin component, RelE family [Candidatus Brocadiaceae bacterium]